MRASWLVFCGLLAFGLVSEAQELANQVKRLLIAKNYAQAEALLTPKLESGDDEMHALLGDVYFAQTRWKDAVRLYSRAIEINSAKLGHHQKLALSYAKLDDTQNEALTLRVAIKKFPKEKSLYASLGNLFEKSGNDYEARGVQLDMIKKFGESTQSQVALCKLYAKEGFFSDSKKYCSKALKKGSKDPNIYRYLSVDLIGENKKPEGIKILKSGVAANPKSAVLYADLGAIFFEDKNWELAELNYKKASEIEKAEEEYLLRLARSAFELGHYEETLKAMRSCMTMNPKKNAAEVRRYSGLLRAQSKLKDAEKFDSVLTEFNY